MERPDFEDLEPEEFPGAPYDVFELKYDGNWGHLVLGGKSWVLWSRNDLIQDSGESAAHITHTVLHGEHIRGTQWSKNHPELYGKIAIFGAEIVEGISLTGMSNDEMRKRIQDFLEKYSEEPIIERCFVVDQFILALAPQIWKDSVINGDFEGLVFKNSKAVWGQDFARMKKDITMDYVCMGFEDSDADSVAGWGVKSVLGGLYIDGELQLVCKVGGLSHELRKEFFDNPEKYIGRVFEAEGKVLFKSGALRHPHFGSKRNPDGWRIDKKSEDCIWSRE